MGRLQYLWHNHRRASVAFVLVAALTFGLGARSAWYAVVWSETEDLDPQIEYWMTPRYVAHSWELPLDVVQTALGDPIPTGRRRTLDDIAAERGIPVADLIARIEAEIARHRSQIPRP